MKSLIYSLIATIVLLPKISFSQNELLKKEIHQFNVQIDLMKDQFVIENKNKSTENLLIISSVELVDKELLIQFNSLPLKNGTYFYTSLEIRFNDQLLELKPENFFGDFNKKIDVNGLGQTHQIIWTNLVEEYIDLKGNLNISLTADFFGSRELPYNVDCGVKPSFTKKQKIPFLIAGILGAGSIGTGQLFKKKSDDEYAMYLVQETFDEAEPFYQNANKSAKRERIFTYAGAGVLAVDAIWFFIKQRRFKKQLETYNEFCNPEKITLQPHFNIEQGSGNLNSGLKLTLNF